MSSVRQLNPDAARADRERLPDVRPIGDGTTRARAWSRLKAGWQVLRTRIHYVRSFLWPDVVLLRGVTECGRPLSILRAGNAEPSAAYFLSGQVLEELIEERPLGRVWLWALPAAARRHGCAIILFRVSKARELLARRLLRGTEHNTFHLPVLIGVTVDVTDRSRLLRSRDLRDDVRRITSRRFTASLSRKSSDLRTFIHEYHDPYVAKVHGFDALGLDLHRLFPSFGDEMPEPWVLLKVEVDGDWIGADLLVDAPGKAALMEIGVKNADPAYVKRGVLQAAYWLSIDYLASRGHKRVSLMHARPFLGSGVLLYKLKYGPTLKPTTSNGFLVQFDMADPTIRGVLLREPLLVHHEDGLQAVWFASDADAAPDPTRVPLDRLRAAGVSNVKRVVLPRGRVPGS